MRDGSSKIKIRKVKKRLGIKIGKMISTFLVYHMPDFILGI